MDLPSTWPWKFASLRYHITQVLSTVSLQWCGFTDTPTTDHDNMPVSGITILDIHSSILDIVFQPSTVRLALSILSRLAV